MAHSSLRPYQTEVIGRYKAAIAAHFLRVLLVAPTGSGKTIIASAIVAEAVAAGKRVIFLAHRRELILQCAHKLHEAGIDHGILLPPYPMRLYEKVQVASIATLFARAIRCSSIEMPPADLVIIDEAHHCRADTYAQIIKAYPGAVVLGLTATPVRGDGRGLGSVFQAMMNVLRSGA
jgi:DNA repair protein RadD